MTEHMSRIKTLPGDVEGEGVDESGGDVLEDLGREVVVAEVLAITFDGSTRDFNPRLEIRGILDVGSKYIRFNGLVGGPVEEVAKEDEPCHGKEFLGGSAQGMAEVLGEIDDGHEFEKDMPKDGLPTVADDPPSDGRDDALKRVEEAVLSRIDGMDHIGRNSLSRYHLSIAAPTLDVKEKKVIS